MKKSSFVLFSLATVVFASGVYADTYGSYAGDSYGHYPENGWLDRPYKVQYQSHSDAVSDWFSISFPDDFDPDQSYPVWLKFCPYYGSRSHLTGPTHAWNYCDGNDVIVIGMNERGIGDHWFGDNVNLDATLRSNTVADVFEILNQLMDLFNITYVAASGPSMGGYASFRVTSLLPSNYVGAVVASCPALWFRSWVQTGSDTIQSVVSNGHYNGKFVKIMHGTADDTVPVQNSRDLTAVVPDTNWWQLVEVSGAGHAEFFAIFDYDLSFPYAEQYGQSTIVPDMWSQIASWEAAHPEIANTVLQPLPGYTGTTAWYFPSNIVAVRADKGPTTNQPPVASAGPDQVVTDWDTNGSESVTLDGSASVDTDGTITNYAWTLGGSPIATGATPTVALNLGTNLITLTVTDDEGATDTNTVTITVGSPDLTPPNPVTGLVGTPGNGYVDLQWTASSSGDVVGNNIYIGGQFHIALGIVTSYTVPSLDNGTQYTLGVRAEDASSNESSIVTVDVTPIGPPPGAIVTSVFQKGVSPDAGYTNMLDSTMRQLTGDSFARQSLGKDPAIDLRYNEYSGTLCMWFDVSSIPTNATIESATLKIWHDANIYDASGSLEVYRIDDPDSTGMWVENDDSSTYTEVDQGCSRYKRPGVAWTVSGGRVDNVISESNKALAAHTGLTDEWLVADVSSDIEVFVADPSVNLGWMIQSASDDTLRGSTYMSDNSTTSKRPILEVVYSTVSPSNVAPTAMATATPTNGFDPLMVDFDASGSSDSDGTITNFAWDFGDGNNSTSVSPTHSYGSAGVYTSVVTVTDDDGDVDSASVVITVNSSLTDSDGDGHTDAEEAIAGTNPNDPQDNLWLTYLAVASGVQWNGVAGRMYDIEKSTQLGTSWEPLAGHQDIAGADGLLSISNITFDSELYLRVKVRQP